MATPVRLRILDALQDLLNTATVANGYPIDVVCEHSRPAVGSREAVNTSILEKPQEWLGDNLVTVPIPNDAANVASVWPLLIQCFPRTVEDAYTMAACVTKVLVEESRRGSKQSDVLGLAAGSPTGQSPVGRMNVGRPVVSPPDGEPPARAFVWLEVSLEVFENRIDPFSWVESQV